ncbi:hypothetical protein BH09MYX1_BH09MYX1_28250 [soil metagenome]
MTNANVDPDTKVAIQVPEDTEAVTARQSLLAKRMRVRTVQAERSHAYAVTHSRTESPEAKKTGSALAVQRFRSGRLAAALQLRKVVVPQSTPESFTVYGRVSDATGMGIAGVVVRATDEAQRHLGEDKTDEQGGFLIRTSGNPNECCDGGKPKSTATPEAPPPAEQPMEPVPVKGRERLGLPDRPGIPTRIVEERPATPTAIAALLVEGKPAAAKATATSRVLYLSAEKDGKTLYRDPTSTSIVLGKVLARELKPTS